MTSDFLTFPCSNVSDISSNVNQSFDGLKLGHTADGVPGYIEVGADTVTPFKKSPILLGTYIGDSTITVANLENYTNLQSNDFILKVTGRSATYSNIMQAYLNGNLIDYFIPTLSYNASSGVLDITGYARKKASDYTSTVTYSYGIYVIG